MATLIDSANRANENPLSDGGKWTGPLRNTDTNLLQVLTNQFAATTANKENSAYRNDQDYGPDVAVSYKLITAIQDGFHRYLRLFARLSNAGGNVTGYQFLVEVAEGVTAIFRLDSGGGATQLGSTPANTLASGDTYELRCVGSAITAWKNGSQISGPGGTDATYGSAGKIGFAIGMTDAPADSALDDFGGNTIGGAAAQTLIVNAGNRW